MIRVDLKGAKELEGALKRLGRTQRRRVLVKALRKAARPMLKEAKRRVPKRSKGLWRSLRIGTTLSSSQRRRARPGQYTGVIFVGASYPKGAHAHLVEFGTYRASPHPFMRPAFESTKRVVFKDLEELIWDELLKHVKRERRKAEAKIGKIR